MKVVDYKLKNKKYLITKETKLISNFILAGCSIIIDYIGNDKIKIKRKLMQNRYIVVGGDTLEDIAKDFDINVKHIKYVNKIDDIYPGLVLLIPSKGDIKLIYSIPDNPILDDEFEREEIKNIPKMISITFDDGPSEYTNKILDLLEQYSSKATFFIQGKKINEYKFELKKMQSNGHQIGNHGYNHREFTDLSLHEVRNEIFVTNQQLFGLGLNPSTSVRPPRGKINEEIKCDMDYPCILWNVDSRDWEKRNKKSIINNVLNNVSEGSIVLFHDLYKETFEALCFIIPELKRLGYNLVTVDELYKNNNIKLEKGKIYKKVIK